MRALAFLCPSWTRTALLRSAPRLVAPSRSASSIATAVQYDDDVTDDFIPQPPRRSLKRDIDAVTTALSFAEKPIVLPSPRRASPYNSLAKAIGVKDITRDDVDWTSAVDRIISRGVPISTNDANAMLAAMRPASRITQGTRLLQHTNPHAHTYDLLLAAHSTLGNADTAIACFAEMQNRGLAATGYTYGHLMGAFARARDLDKALALYNQMEVAGIEQDLIVSTSLMACCVRTGATERAFDIFDTLKYRSTRYAPDVTTYSLLIHACLKSPEKSAERAQDLFTEMQEKGHKPNRYTYNTLIRVFASRSTYFVEAWQVADQMQRDGVELDKITYYALLAACVTAQDLIRARKLVKELLSRAAVIDGEVNEAWKIDRTMWQLLMRAYASGRAPYDKTPVDHVFDPANALPLPQSSSGGLLLDKDVLTTTETAHEAQRVLRYLAEHDADTVDTQLLDAYIGVLHQRKATNALRDACFGPSNLFARLGLAQSPFTYRTALLAAYDARDLDLLNTAWHAYRAHVEHAGPSSCLAAIPGDGTSPDIQTHARYIEALARLDRLDDAVQVLFELYDDPAHGSAINGANAIPPRSVLKCLFTKAIQLEKPHIVDALNLLYPPRVLPGSRGKIVPGSRPLTLERDVSRKPGFHDASPTTKKAARYSRAAKKHGSKVKTPRNTRRH
ncbi:hypothetical protein PYCC9005_003341 [Savitreella phatthalungensis]